ncbi:hypothetical protein JCM33374_g4999 [Metschnikowia sp. JCM 33374]|nr:hypothetical protein JCM33374_g4999 [Metschnikowia sp. JCM 33374]
MSRQKVVLITGASSGIGFATASEFAKRGYKVYACARRLEPMQPLKEQGVITVVCDVTQIKDVCELRDLISRENDGRLDILYNNAGQPCTTPAVDAADEIVARCYEVNVFAPIRITREFTALLIKAKGTIGFTGSVSGVVPVPFLSIYSSTKAALHQYVATLRVEMKPFGVTVLNFVTGSVRTPIKDDRGLPEGSLFQVPGIEEPLAELREMSDRSMPIPAEKYAYQVVNDFERQHLGGKLNIYRGRGGLFCGPLDVLVP